MHEESRFVAMALNTSASFTHLHLIAGMYRQQYRFVLNFNKYEYFGTFIIFHFTEISVSTFNFFWYLHGIQCPLIKQDRKSVLSLKFHSTDCIHMQENFLFL
jgi:hypothetical protein